MSSINSLKQPRKSVLGVFATLAAVLAVSVVHAEEHKQSPGERAVEYRQSVFNVMAGNFGPVHMMGDGKMPFNAADAVKHSERAAYLAKMLDDAFPANSNGVGKTDAKPEIWQDTAGFQKKLQALIDATDAVAAAAKTGDLAKLKAAAGDAGKTCKDCHDKFKKD